MLKKLSNTVKSLGRFGPILAFAVIAPGIGALLLAASAGYWFEPLKSSPSNALVIYILASTLLVSLSLIPTHAASLIAGILFGAVRGPTYAFFSIITASLLSYILVKFLLRKNSIEIMTMNPKAHKVYKELLNHNGFRSFYIIVLIRLSPVMPFAGTNVLLAAGKVKPIEFLIGSAFGLAPRIIIVAMAGAGLSKLDLKQGSHQGLLILGAAATLLAVFVIGRLGKRALKDIQSKEL